MGGKQILLPVRVIPIRPWPRLGDDLIAFQARVQHPTVHRNHRWINPGIAGERLAQGINMSEPIVRFAALDACPTGTAPLATQVGNVVCLRAANRAGLWDDREIPGRYIRSAFAPGPKVTCHSQDGRAVRAQPAGTAPILADVVVYAGRLK